MIRSTQIFTTKDLLDKTHFPMIIINEIRNTCFMRTLEQLSQGIGFGVNGGVCLFPGDLDEYDIANGEMFEGVNMVFCSGQEIVLSYETFYYYLKIACYNQVEYHKADKLMVDTYLKAYREKFNIKDDKDIPQNSI